MRKACAFILGMVEFRSGFTTRHNTRSERDAYDWGREWAHRLTFRRHEA
jgi:hypothetical protein